MKKVLMMMLLCLTTSALIMAGCDKNNNQAQRTESTVETTPEQKVPEVTEKEAKNILQANINEIVQSFSKMEKENDWNRNNPRDFETAKAGLKNVISEHFTKNQLSELLRIFNASRDTDMQPFPIHIEPEIKFSYAQEKEKLKMNTFAPANDAGNSAEIWEFYLIYKDGKWLMDEWSFHTKADVNLTKEEADKFLHILEFKDITFIKEEKSNHTKYIFKVRGQVIAVNAATSVIEYGYKDHSSIENQEKIKQEETNQQHDSSHHTNQGTQKSSEEKTAAGLSKAKFLNELASLEKQEKHSENALTTVDTRKEINENYQLWDDKLNEIYRVLKNNLPATTFETLKSKQIAWIKSKESRVQAIVNDQFNGTMKFIDAAQEQYTMTKERCYELVNSYMN